MYKWGPDGKCKYKSLRECQTANGPPTVASHDDFERMYRSLSENMRQKWDLTRFIQLCSAPFQTLSGGGNVVKFSDFERHKLPKAEENEFGGIASATGVLIEGWTPTIINQGAFKNTLSNAAERNRVKVLYQHSLPIGKPTFMEETNEGLIVMGKVSGTELGTEVMQLMRDGVIDEMSIGWDPVEFHFREEENDFIRVVTELRLWEFSAVTFGANPGAKISVVNSLRGISQEADAALDRFAHAAKICCDDCKSGGDCCDGESEKNQVETQSALTLLSTALDRVRHGSVTQEEKQALVPLVTMFGRVLSPSRDSAPSAIEQDSIDVEAALRELDELTTQVQ